MIWYHIVEKNTRSSALADSAYEDLKLRIVGEISCIEEKQADALAKFLSAAKVMFFKPYEQAGDYGLKLWKCRSSHTELTLYVNNPIGWLWGRFVKVSPLGGLSKYFAVNLDGQIGSSVTCVSRGCYELPSKPTWDDLLKELTEAVVTDLALGFINEADIPNREHER